MKKLIPLGVACLLSMVAIAADQLVLKDNHPDHHIVQKGDTLWDIAAMFLRDPWQWPEIWQVNPQVENPHLIFPGDNLKLVYQAGQPRLMVERGEGSRTVVLTPHVRISPIDNAIPAIPLDKVNAFLTRSRIIEDDSLDTAPYVVSGGGGHIISGAGDKVYARGAFDHDEPVYGIYRRGQIFQDPDTGEVLGLEAVDIGAGKVVAVDGEIATLNLNRSNEEVRVKDRLLPFQERKITATFFPSAPKEKVTAVIVAVEGGVTQVGKMDIVAINRGEREGMEVGHVLAIYKRGEVIRDTVTNELLQLPDVRSGLLMVFRTFDKMSYGLVLSADKPLAVGDKLHNP